MEPESKFVELSDVRLRYLEWPGEGRTAILVHGSGLCADTWKPIAERLAARFRVLAFDLRGHGDSDKPHGHFTWPEVAGDLPAFMDALDLSDVLLVGHSRGGGVATLGGAQRPDRVWRMALMEPTVALGRPGPTAPPPQGANANPLAEITRRRRTVWSNHDEIFQAWSRSNTLRNLHPDALWAYIHGGTRRREDGMLEIKCPPEVEAEFYEHATPDYMYEAMDNITWPVLLLTTDNPRRQVDENPGYIRLRETSRDFRHVIFPGLSHFFPLEKPHEVAQEILDFASD